MAVITASDEHRSDIWWLFLLEGIAAVLFGVLLLTAPGATLVALAVVLGFYFLAMGVLELVRIFVDRSQPWIWSLLIGILGIAAGVLVLNHPLFAAVVLPTTLVVYLGILGLVFGAMGIIGAFSGGGIGSFILGAVNLVIGLLLLGSPLAAAIAVPFVFGILLLIEGIALIIWSFTVRSP
jgi:uncharacterized membrane protein HdeD (DUF308 family)